MDFDLELWLVIATAITGLIWLLYAIFNRKKEKQSSNENERSEPIIVEYSRSFFPVLLIVLVLRSFIAEPFRIPSGSMIPTLEIGDFILVNKSAYGVKLPVIHTKVMNTGDVERGDVVVFRYPVDNKTDYIKRVIGLPGDTVEWRKKQLFINGTEIPQIPVGKFAERDQRNNVRPALRLTEKLDTKEHDIIVQPNLTREPGRMTVPPNSYFVMGDNRDNSNDSRTWGIVPESNVVGEAIFVWMHWRSGSGLDTSRIGTVIK